MKNPFKSLTIWGMIVMLLPTLGNLVGFEISQGETQDLVDRLQTISLNVSEFIGAVMVLWGRWRAKGPLAFK